MIKQNINIVGVPILYNILEEIKENLSFKIENFTKRKLLPDEINNKTLLKIRNLDLAELNQKKN